MDNKKLTKILGIALVIVLLFVIVLRLALKRGEPREAELPNMSEEITYNPKKEVEKTKTQQFEEDRQKENESKYGSGAEQYAVPNFNEVLTTKQEPNPNTTNQTTTLSEPNKTTSTPNTSGYNYNPNVNTTPTPNYESSYFKKNQEQSPVSQQASSQGQPVQQVAKNPFGTVKTGGQYGSGEVNSSAQLKAEIYGDQKIPDGGAVNIRVVDQFLCNGITVPKNSILFGQAKYYGNRVIINVHRAKTPQGEFPIQMSVLDNDRIEGIFYKAPVDETSEKTQDQTDVPVGGTYGSVLNKVGKTIVDQGKDLLQKTRALKVEDGYIIYLIYPKK